MADDALSESDDGFGALPDSYRAAQTPARLQPTVLSRFSPPVPIIVGNSIPVMPPGQYDILDRCIGLALAVALRPIHEPLTAQFSVQRRMAGPWIDPLAYTGCNRSQLLLPVPVQPAQVTMRINQGVLVSAAVRRVYVTPWPEQEAAKRHKALSLWRIILEENLNCTSLGRQLHDMALAICSDQQMTEAVNDTFSCKSTSTLGRRASSLMKFLLWHRSQMGTAGLPLKESKCYEYIKTLQTGGSPTAPSSFLQAVTFGHFVLDMMGALEVSRSARLNGVKYTAMKRKRPRKQSRELLVDEVVTLEGLGQKADCNFDRYASLFFLLCLFARSRFTGMALATNLIADLDANHDGFIEVGTQHSKVHRKAEQLSLFLPLVAPAVGVTGFKWGKAFLQEREAQGIDKYRYLLPTPGASGKWIDEPTEVGDAGRWLRALLTQGGHKNVENAATHSLKRTPLSWASKYGSPLDIRALLGYHVGKEVTSTLCYSRDAQAAPLAELIKIIHAIHIGAFLPDQTRSGRILQPDKMPARTNNTSDIRSVESASISELVPIEKIALDVIVQPEFVHDHGLPEVGCTEDQYEKPELNLNDDLRSASSESSSDSSSSESSVDESEAKLLRKVQLPVPEVLEDRTPYLHQVSRLLHFRRDTQFKLECGRRLSVSYVKYKWQDTAGILKCAQCFR